MSSSTGMAIIALVFGAGFLVAALASTLSRVALLTEIRHSESPKAFCALILFYWVLGLTGTCVGIAALLGGFRA
jgi:TctA family transporter